MAVLKKNIFAPPASPFAFYIGAGVGVHYLNTEVAQLYLQGSALPTQSDTPLSMLGTVAKASGAGLFGVTIAPPAFPLAIFGEASYEVIFASERLNLSQYSAGLLLRF